MELALEGPPQFENALGWRPYFDRMLELGMSQRRACANVLLCAKYSSKRELARLMHEHTTVAALQEALDIEIAKGADARLDDGFVWSSYPHTPLYLTSREEAWDEFDRQVGRGPIHGNSGYWRGLFDRMVSLGMEPDRVRRNILRIARFGPARSVVEKTVEQNPDPAALQAALDLFHSDALDLAWEMREEGDLLGYRHPRRQGSETGAIKKLRNNSVIHGATPSTPDEAKPVEAKPDAVKPDEAKPDEAKPDEAKPDEATPFDEADVMNDEVDLDKDIDLDEDPDLDAEIDALEGGFDEDPEAGSGADGMGDGGADAPPSAEDEAPDDMPPEDE